ncbi:alpha/beta hydrolase [Streptomyces pseudovenezuelae]|uniref:Alpha/beta hydrolase n=1 Tax=Streptomyces pseudovenezuelae TaxID=67350 RepID=A0ABT6LPW8_9ACTN|nr:alpha/beta hydrolase [Streptomyces pseudovenezuelae]MDH6218360.1 hypothetical protein [Streptomyces pseudovenezuelae]
MNRRRRNSGFTLSPGRRLLRPATLALAATALLWQAVLPGGAVAQPSSGAETPPGASLRVATAAYDLGGIYTDPDISTPLDVSAVVHYPADLGRGGRPRPLIVQEHGLWYTCADREAEHVVDTTPPPPIPPKDGPVPPPTPESEALDRAYHQLTQWPCRPGVEPLPSDAGYDYLGEYLAAQGFVVVSIDANAINAVADTDAVTGDEYAARANLVNEHLALWQRLVRTGRGPLAGKFTDAVTGRPARVDFRGRVDLREVGTMGHSRGGKGVLYQAADVHRDQWPAGVEIKAVAAVAPVYDWSDGADHNATLVTRAAVAGLTGTCDASGGNSTPYFDNALGRNHTGLYDFKVHGAEHNYFNTQWSPRSGQVMASDDAEPYGEEGSGLCTERDTRTGERELTEAQQRRVAEVYLSAFFRRHLLNDTRTDPVLRGDGHPLADVTRIDVQAG